MAARADPLGRLTRYGYDERGNLTCITRPDGSQVRARYDGANLLVGLEEPDGASWRQEYDARGNLVRRIAPDLAVTSFGYDQRGHLASVTDPLGARALHRPKSRTLTRPGRPSGSSTRRVKPTLRGAT